MLTMRGVRAVAGRLRPRIVLLADRPRWAFDFTARSLRERLRDRFDIVIRYVKRRPRLRPDRFDLLYVFFWGETWHERFEIDPNRIVREVASYRWANELRYGPMRAERLVERHLDDCRLVTTPCSRLRDELAPILNDRIVLLPKGYEPSLFFDRERRRGRLRIGWVGNPRDECKGLFDILVPACKDRFDFRWSSGRWRRRKVARFYNDIDVLAIASTAESQPLPLIESMACGCFPVTTDVGIVPELVRHGENGLVVPRTVDAFRDAFAWCETNLDTVRNAGRQNAAELPGKRSWDVLAERWAAVFERALGGEAG